MPIIISSDTVWRSGETINLNDTIQIAAGATLRIEAGAIVNGNGNQIQTFGKLVVAGTQASNINLNNIRFTFGADFTTPGRMDIDYARINGGTFLPATGNGSYGSFALTNNVISGASASYIWYPTSASTISGNVFYNTGGLGIGSGVAVGVTDNVFINTGGGFNGTAAVVAWAAYGPAIDVSQNSFFGQISPALEVSIDGKMNAVGNYFGTLNHDVVQSMIIDKNDDLNKPNYINAEPATGAPSTLALEALVNSGLPIRVGTVSGDSLTGTSGSDTIYAGDGDDYITDPGGSDRIYAGGGNDRVSISRGDNGTLEQVVIDAGSGDDDVTYQNYRSGSLSVTLGDGSDRITLWNTQSGGTSLSLGAGRDTVMLAGAFAASNSVGQIGISDFAAGATGDILDLGTYINSALRGWDGSANPFGSSGYFRLMQSGNATLLQVDRDGGSGSAFDFATLFRLDGTLSEQFVAGNFGEFNPDGSVTTGLSLIGTAGSDTLTGSTGADTILGFAGSDTIDGGAGNDRIDGGDGNDIIQSGSGDDIVDGGDGNDRISDDGGSDLFRAGRGDDYISISRGDNSTFENVIIEAGDGADTVTYQNYRAGSLTADLGGGDDDVTLWTVQNGGSRITLGVGKDTVTLSSLIDIHNNGRLVITDFEAGSTGDRLNAGEYLNRALTGWNGSSNPFGGAGYLRLVQAGSDVLLQIDKDGAASSAQRFNNLLTLENMSASSLVAANLGGFTPSIVSASDIATASVLAPATVVEGQSGALSIVLKNVSTASGSVSMSFASELSSAAAGLDVSVPLYQGSFSVAQSPIGSYTINLPTFSTSQDSLLEGTESIAIRVKVTGQTFATGTDETVVYVNLVNGDQVGTAAGETITGNAARNIIRGEGGDDSIFGLFGNDDLYGGAGNDLLDGGQGNDFLNGGAGDDIIRPGIGRDVIDGGDGRDTLELAAGPSSVSIAKAGDHVVIVAGNDAVQVTGVEQVRFGNGLKLDWADVIATTTAFDSLSYIASHSDLRTVYGVDASAGEQHFLRFGFAEERGISFNALEYIASYSDLRQAFGIDPTAGAQHFIRFGAGENRTSNFNGWTYLASYSDLIQAYGTNETAATQHFIRFGANEGRVASFDANAYAAANPDLAAAFGTDQEALARHYVQWGYAEGRSLGTDATASVAVTSAYPLDTAAQGSVSSAVFDGDNARHPDAMLSSGSVWHDATSVVHLDNPVFTIA